MIKTYFAKILPCDSEMIDISAGIPRSLALKNFTQAFRFSYFLSCVGGAKIWYENHWDRRLLKYFNRQSYEQHYLLVAELLELNTHIRGLFGASWWYDPCLQEISPELSFLQSVPVKNGAALFSMGSDEATTHDAISYSKERSDIYKEGKYNPQIYFLVWPRKALLKWAEEYRQEQVKAITP